MATMISSTKIALEMWFSRYLMDDLLEVQPTQLLKYIWVLVGIIL